MSNLKKRILTSIIVFPLSMYFILMGSIFELYKLANESASTNFKWGGSKKVNLDLGFTSRNMNKWNPADIFYANKTAVKEI